MTKTMQLCLLLKAFDLNCFQLSPRVSSVLHVARPGQLLDHIRHQQESPSNQVCGTLLSALKAFRLQKSANKASRATVWQGPRDDSMTSWLDAFG